MVEALKRLGRLPQRKYHNAYYPLVLSCVVEPCGGFNGAHLKRHLSQAVARQLLGKQRTPLRRLRVVEGLGHKQCRRG